MDVIIEVIVNHFILHLYCEAVQTTYIYTFYNILKPHLGFRKLMIMHTI